METVGQKIRKLRETKNLLIRQVAAVLELDQAIISKIERGERKATRKQIVAFANFFGIDRNGLLTLWLGEKIANEIADEDIANDALKVAEEAVKYIKKIKNENNINAEN